MIATMHPALTQPKPLNTHEWWADSSSCKDFYLALQFFVVQAIAKQTGERDADVRRSLLQLWPNSAEKAIDDYALLFSENLTDEQQDQVDAYDLKETLKASKIPR